MASEHEHNDWRLHHTDMTHAYAVCRVCGVRGKRLLQTGPAATQRPVLPSDWEIYEIEGKPPTLEQQLAQAKDIIRGLYGSFRWETHTDLQETACKDAEQFLDLPAEQRREW